VLERFIQVFFLKKRQAMGIDVSGIDVLVMNNNTGGKKLYHVEEMGW
jgi:hypothetical protein